VRPMGPTPYRVKGENLPGTPRWGGGHARNNPNRERDKPFKTASCVAWAPPTTRIMGNASKGSAMTTRAALFRVRRVPPLLSALRPPVTVGTPPAGGGTRELPGVHPARGVPAVTRDGANPLSVRPSTRGTPPALVGTPRARPQRGTLLSFAAKRLPHFAKVPTRPPSLRWPNAPPLGTAPWSGWPGWPGWPGRA
jgi:hypothetical protein